MPKTPHSSGTCPLSIPGTSSPLLRRAVVQPVRAAPRAQRPSASSTVHSMTTFVRPPRCQMTTRRCGRSRAAGTPALARGARARASSRLRRRRSRGRATPIRRTASRRARSTPPSDIDAPASSTSAPTPPLSKQHSASVTASPPSAQSCADRPGRAPARSTSSRCSARSAARSSAGGSAAQQAVHRLQILAAAELAEARRRAARCRGPLAGNTRVTHASTRLRCSPTTPMTGVGRIGAAVGFVVETDVAAGDRNRRARGTPRPGRRRPRQTAT